MPVGSSSNLVSERRRPAVVALHRAAFQQVAAVLTQQLELSHSENINEPVRNAVVCQNFLQRWPVYTVKCLFVIDEVNNEVLLML